MKTRNLVFVLLSIGMVLLGYYIGKGRNSQQIVSPGQKSGDTLSKIKSDGRLIVGIGQEAAPFGYRENNELVGFDVDIARAIAGRLEEYAGRKVSLEFKSVTDETRIAWVQSGEVHLSLCHTNITRKRLANVDFSVPYGWDGKGILYRRAEGKRDLDWFAGKSIGIKRSSSSEGEIKSYFENKGWTLPSLRQFDNHAAGIRALMDGQIDGFTDDNSIIINTAMLAGYKVGLAGPLSMTDTSYSPTFFGIAAPQNDSVWRDTLNYCLHDLWLSGDFQTIYDKWFGPKSMCPIPLKDHKMEPFVKG
ncbi:MAG TPA: transporter substrate-binding domain-containing protein [Candidatus Angelobacter sp.]|jgi:polar amino acid transport system substrate-binding protein|nr:transporter substrate-binding domain-containing protein [Candidatus Angelobacter sp.]